MKLTFKKDDLLNGINIVLKAVPSKTTMSILECILIDASTGDIKLTANDMELGIETRVEGSVLEKGKIALDARLFSPQPDYLLRVQGDSMIDDAILDGDLVGVRRTPDAHDGQVVVARLDGELTIKRLRRTPGVLQLMPRNIAYSPIVVQADQDFAIEGVFCGLVRRG